MVKNITIGAEELAFLAKISLRCAQKAIKKAVNGKPWRGSLLDVVPVKSSGGNRGVSYRINVSSLPNDLQPKSTTSPAHDMDTYSVSRTALLSKIKSSGPKGSRERGKAIRSLLASGATCDGKLLTERTIRSWLKADEERGLLASVRQSRSDRGQSRVIAWRAWDRAMDSAGVPTHRQQEMAAKIDHRVRSLWASGVPSVSKVQMFMEHFCRKLALSAGLEAADPRLNMICRTPKNFISKPARTRAKLIHRKRTDASGYASDIEPRVPRTRKGMLPMDEVSADVRHCDFLARRQDGSITTAKMIAFQDLATNRLFVRSFICPKGEAIRREHVLATMRDMFADPSWGIPKNLYFDNGGEFQTGTPTDDLSRLVALIRDVGGDITIKETSSLPAGIIRSRPYNPQSKVIEGVFSNITRTIEPMLPGFIGGNRMKKKVENQGKAPVPMPGNEADIHEAIRNEIEFYNATPQQKGEIAGFSPNTKMAEFRQNGWRAIIIEPTEFGLAFGPVVTRTIRTGGVVSIDNRRFRHDDMMPMVDEKMRFRIPLLENGMRIIALDDHDEPLFVAYEEKAFHMLDRAGASEQARQSKALSKAIRSDAAGLEKIDLAGEMARYAADNPAPRPATPEAEVTLSPVLKEAARQRQPEAPAKLSDREEFLRTQDEAFQRMNASLMRRRA